MELPQGESLVAAKTLVQERILGIQQAIKRQIGAGDLVVNRSTPDIRKHLFEEACELYWNELSWEAEAAEEMVGDDLFTEMVFPGLLTLIDALLPRSENGEPDRDHEHRDVVNDFLEWLTDRFIHLRGASSDSEDERERIRQEREVADDLIDLIAFRICSLTNDEIEICQSR